MNSETKMFIGMSVFIFGLILIALSFQMYFQSSIDKKCLEDIGINVCKEKVMHFDSIHDGGFVIPDFYFLCNQSTSLDYRITGKYEDISYKRFNFYPNEIEECRK